MIRTLEKLAHLSVIGIVLLFFLMIYVLVPTYDMKIAISVAFTIVAFGSCFIIFRQLLGLLLISFFLVMIITWFITRSIFDSLFFSSIVVVIIILFNILEH